MEESQQTAVLAAPRVVSTRRLAGEVHKHKLTSAALDMSKKGGKVDRKPHRTHVSRLCSATYGLRHSQLWAATDACSLELEDNLALVTTNWGFLAFETIVILWNQLVLAGLVRPQP